MTETEKIKLMLDISSKVDAVSIKMDKEIREREKLSAILFGDNGTEGVFGDVKDIKRELVGDKKFNKEGVLDIVKKHNEFYNKMQSMGKMALLMVSVGGAIGSAFMWIAHRIDKIKELF